MEDGCIHNIFDNTCNKYGYLCNATAQQKAKCSEWGLVKAYEDSLITNAGTQESFKPFKLAGGIRGNNEC